MAIKENRIKLKEYFETGDRPSEAEFIKFIDSMIIQDEDVVWVSEPDNNVGIGTKLPDEKLHVDGNVKIEGNISNNKPNGVFSIYSAAHFQGPYVDMYGKNAGNRGGEMTFVASEGAGKGFRFLQYEKDGSGNDHWHSRLKIASDGNVGIGTETPDEKLDVDGNIKLSGDISGRHSWRALTISAAPNLQGPYMHFNGKGVQGGGGEITFVASEGDKQGFNFLQYEKDGNGNNHWHPRLRIKGDGNVGIGTETPDEKLDVDGSIKLSGDISGRHSWRALTISAAPNLQGPYMHFNGKDVQGGGGEMTFVASEGDKQGFNFFQYEKDGNGNSHWRSRLRIKGNGNVGIGTEDAQNKLEIKNTGGGNTGLRLPEGAAAGKVLISDGQGNAEWQTPNVLDDGDWVIDGQDIHSGKSGNVGIGVVNPIQKLQVNGNIMARGHLMGTYDHETLTISGAQIPDAPYLRLRGKNDLNRGGEMTFVSSEGGGRGFRFLQYEKDSSGNEFWRDRLRISKYGNVGIGTDSPNEKLHVNGKSLLDGDLNVKGAIKAHGQTPILVERMVLTGMSIHYSAKDGNYGYNTNVSFADYSAAVIVGFASSEAGLEGIIGAAARFKIAVSTYKRGTTWWVSADIHSLKNFHEKWAIDVMFIRNEISALAGGGWGVPLSEKV